MKKKNKAKKILPRLVKIKDVLSTFEWITHQVSRLTGSWTFIFIHILWTIIWFYLGINSELFTLILSIEAIILVSILLMSANQQYKVDSAREEEDYQVDLYTAGEIDNIKKSLEKIQKDIKDLKTYPYDKRKD